MNSLYGTASVNDAQETAESISTNITGKSEHECKTECTTVGAAGVKRKQLRLITWNNSGKYTFFV